MVRLDKGECKTVATSGTANVYKPEGQSIMAKNTKANATELADKINLSASEQATLTTGGLATAQAMKTAKAKTEILKASLKVIVTEKLGGLGFDLCDESGTKDCAFPVEADSELFRVIRSRIATSMALYGCASRDCTKAQIATVKQVQRSFDSLNWEAADKASLSEAQKAAILHAIAECAYMSELSLEQVMTFRLNKEELESEIGNVKAEDQSKD